MPIAIVFFSATQDIAIDAYRTDVSAPSERGLAAAAANLGLPRRRPGWPSPFALIVADHFGYRAAFLVLARIMLLFCDRHLSRAAEPTTATSPAPCASRWWNR